MISDSPSSGSTATASKVDTQSIHIPKDIIIRSLTASSRVIYYSLKKKPSKVSELQKTTKYSTRTIRYALKHLQNIGLVSQIPDMNDLRSHKYRAK